MQKIELNNFYNKGFGWICRLCERRLKEAETNSREKQSRLMREGEAESKQPTLSNQAMAKWTDETKKILVCPRCGITERVEKL